MSISCKEDGNLVKKAGIGIIDNILNKFSNHAVSNKAVSEEFEKINNDLTAKVSGFTETTYSAVTGLAYDSTNKKLGLKVGADTVIPFSGKELIYLGTIRGDSTMNIKTKYPNEYANFTTSNFICERSTGGSNNYGGVGYNYLEVPTFSKSYSSSTGILSVSGNYAGIGLGSSVYQSISTTVKVYLVK